MARTDPTAEPLGGRETCAWELLLTAAAVAVGAGSSDGDAVTLGPSCSRELKLDTSAADAIRALVGPAGRPPTVLPDRAGPVPLVALEGPATDAVETAPESLDEPVPSANAAAGRASTATPTPILTANAPTRPTYLDEPEREGPWIIPAPNRFGRTDLATLTGDGEGDPVSGPVAMQLGVGGSRPTVVRTRWG